MCLYSRQAYYSTAAKDITCYKVVRAGYLYDMDHWKFPAMYYSKFVYEVGKTYTEKKFKNRPERDLLLGVRRIVYHGFHTYKYHKDARNNAYSWTVMLKCVIPAGARYFTNEDRDQYCSDQIRVVAWKMKNTPWNEEPHTGPRFTGPRLRLTKEKLK